MGKKIESAASFMERICNDNSHGYSMQNRWGDPDYDCSSLVISCYEQAGVPVKTRGATYTGNMYATFLSCGFEDVTSKCNLASGSGMQRGDVLLNHQSHTAMYLGNGKVGHARSSEGNSIIGDQSGNEIRIQSYWNYPWNCVLRYVEDEIENPTNTPGTTSQVLINLFKPSTPIHENLTPNTYVNVSLPLLQKGMIGTAVVMIQAALKSKGYNIGIDGIDGDFGANTEKALKQFQKNNNLSQDGKCGKEIWNLLIK